MHDRAVTACPVALKRVDIAFDACAFIDDSGYVAHVLSGERDIHDGGIGQSMGLVARTDDDGGNLFLGQCPGAGDGGDIDTMAVCNCAQG